MSRLFRRTLRCMALLALLARPAAAEPITLRVADNLPPSHFLSRYATRWFMDEVTRRTKGEVAFEYYPSEQLGKARDLLALTRSGVADIALVTPSIVSERMPLSSVAEQPGGFATSCQGTLAYYDLARDGFLEEREFRPNGVRMLVSYVNPPYQLFTARRPAGTLAALSGMKIRSLAGTQEIAVQKLGAVPVRTSTTEVYEAMSRGTVDGMLFPVPTVVAYDLQRLVRYATQGENFGSIANAYVIGLRRWQALPDDVRRVLDEVGREATRRACEMTDRDVATTLARFEGLGIARIRYDEADHARLKELFSSVGEEWARRLEARGKPAREGLEAFARAIKGTGAR